MVDSRVGGGRDESTHASRTLSWVLGPIRTPTTLSAAYEKRRAYPAGIASLVLWLAVLLPSPVSAASQSAKPCSAELEPAPAPHLRVVVSGARRVAGNITFTLYGEDPTLFLKGHGSIALTRVALSGTTAEACFAVSAPGIYAVAVYHDENDNHHLDRNFLGLPAEGYGFSNDAPTVFGPPAFDAVRLTVRPGDNRIAIRLRY